MSDEESFINQQLNLSQNLGREMLDDRVVRKVEYMREISERICSSWFPKFKYLQVMKKGYMVDDNVMDELRIDKN